MSSPTQAGGNGGEAAGSAAAQDGDVTHPMKAFASELSKLQNQVQALQSTKLQEQVLKLRESVKGKRIPFPEEEAKLRGEGAFVAPSLSFFFRLPPLFSSSEFSALTKVTSVSSPSAWRDQPSTSACRLPPRT